MASSVLRPMPRDGLAPRPAPQASAGGQKPQLISQLQPEAPAYLRPAAFSAPEEEDLLAGFVIEDEPDDMDDEPDLMDSQAMPYPACVPLYEVGDSGKRRRVWPVIAACAVVLAAAAFLILK